MKTKNVNKGFTLIEVLLVITLIGILLLIGLVNFNYQSRLVDARNDIRKTHIQTLESSITQYRLQKGSYPIGLTRDYQEICDPDATICTGFIDLKSSLVPDFIQAIPQDPKDTDNSGGSGYEIAVDEASNTVGIRLKESLREGGVNLAINEDFPIDNNLVVNSALSESNPLLPPVPVATSEKDPNFYTGIQIGFSNTLNTTSIQSDGKILVGGAFTTYQGVSVNRIIRLNSNGSVDSSFNIGTGFNNTVTTIAIQSDGKILVGGVFTTYQGVSANRIIRLNTNGSRDSSFNIGTGFNNNVNTIAIQSDGKILVGGVFTSYQGVVNNYIIRLNSDGSRDSSFNIGAGFNSTVNTIDIQSDGKMLVGGIFTSYQGVSANRIIRLNSDGSRDSSFNIGTGFNNVINIIAIQSDGKILVGGVLTAYQGVSANRIIRLNSDGSRDSSFNIGTGFNNVINTIVIQSDGKILIGGAFISYQGVSVNRIIRLNSDGSRDSSFNMETGTDNNINTIAIQSDGKILIVGVFTTYQGLGVNRSIRLNSDGSRDSSFNIGTGTDNNINTIAIQSDGRILVGGVFTTYQGVSANRIIRLNSDGSRDSSFNIGTGFNSTVNTIAIQSDGKILAGGAFTTYQGVASNYIIRLNSDGSRDSSFNIGAGFNSTVNTIDIQSDGRILVGGVFTTYQGVSANRIIRLNSDGSRDSSFNIGTGFNNNVTTIAIQSDGKILVGGAFTTYQGVVNNYIIRLNSDGSRDSSFNIGAGFNSTVNTIDIQSDGKMLVGGIFPSYQGVATNRIIRLNSDGSRDSSFNIGTGFNNNVTTIAIQSDGKILVGGAFTSYQGVVNNYIIRLNSDGSRDSIFNTGTDNNVNTIAIQSDGKIIIAGNFSTYKSQAVGYIVRVGQ